MTGARRNEAAVGALFTLAPATASRAPGADIGLTVDWNGVVLARPFPVTGGPRPRVEPTETEGVGTVGPVYKTTSATTSTAAA